MFDTDELVLNMGPQHPATHGVLRVILKLDGEKVVDAEVVIGYLHRGIEKLSENRDWTQIILLTDRSRFPVGRVTSGRSSRNSNAWRAIWCGWAATRWTLARSRSFSTASANGN
jgi:hypothetical protein